MFEIYEVQFPQENRERNSTVVFASSRILINVQDTGEYLESRDHVHKSVDFSVQISAIVAETSLVVATLIINFGYSDTSIAKITQAIDVLVYLD